MRKLTVGDPVPWFTARASNSDKFRMHTLGGRYVALCFFGSAGRPEMAAMLQELSKDGNVFDDKFAVFFGVSNDANDEAQSRAQQRIPGIRYFWDFDGGIAGQYGLLQRSEDGASANLQATTIVLDTNLRVIGVLPIDNPATHAKQLLEFVSKLPPLRQREQALSPAPILIVPRVFEPELCRELIGLYEKHGGEDSGFMQTNDEGQTIAAIDHNFKKRSDYHIEDKELKDRLVRRVRRRLVPEIQKAFQFKATRIERYIVACYDAAETGRFRAHRDNTTKGTAHRRFACTLNLNSEDYEGGELLFPEYDQRTYKPPTGGAVIFSCSMLHEATPVTKGVRYVFLPFLYDDPAADIRQENLKYLANNDPFADEEAAQASA